MPMPKGVQAIRSAGETRSKTVKVNLTPTELAQVHALAHAAGQSASAWAYSLIAPLLPTTQTPADTDQDPLPFPEQERT